MKNPATIRRRTGVRGLTLVELMVSLAIMCVMMVIVMMLLEQSRQSIRLSQSMIQTNANARAAIDQMRRDVPQITKDGFMAIVAPTADTPPVLMFTTVGNYWSRSLWTASLSYVAPNTNTRYKKPANAAVICYYLKQDFSGNPATADILCREVNLLWRGGSWGENYKQYWSADTMDRTLGRLGSYTREQLAWSDTNGTGIVGYRAQLYASNTNAPLYSVPWRVDQCYALWRYMIQPVQNFSVEFTRDGTNWNGFRYTSADGGKTWSQVTSPASAPLTVFDPANDDQVDFTGLPSWAGSNGAYEALWTYRRKDLWPRAIRVRFQTGDTSQWYEATMQLPP